MKVTKYEQTAQGIMDLHGLFFLAYVETIFLVSIQFPKFLPLPLGITIIANFPRVKSRNEASGYQKRGHNQSADKVDQYPIQQHQPY